MSDFLNELRKKAKPLSKKELKELEDFRKTMPTKLERTSLVSNKVFGKFKIEGD